MARDQDERRARVAHHGTARQRKDKGEYGTGRGDTSRFVFFVLCVHAGINCTANHAACQTRRGPYGPLTQPGSDR
jgi:hypothetical protein